MSDDLADSPFEAVDDDSPADGDPAGSQAGGPMQRLFDGNAQGPPRQELEADYGVPTWLAISLRGILRVATGSGIPPLFEIVFGVGMGGMRYAQNSDLDVGGDGSDERADQGSPDVVTPDGG